MHSHIAAHAAVMSSVNALTSVRLKRRLPMFWLVMDRVLNGSKKGKPEPATRRIKGWILNEENLKTPSRENVL